MTTSGPLLNVRQTAERLGVHENTVRNWANAGVLASHRKPGSHAHTFAPEDVDAMLAERASSPDLTTLRARLAHVDELLGQFDDRLGSVDTRLDDIVRLLRRVAAAVDLAP